MGLDAFVHCRCFENGLTSDPPYPTTVDADGRLSPPAELELTDYLVWDAWEDGACEHDRMRGVSERIANWGGYRQFQSALDARGIENFPTLQRELPKANGGQCSAGSSAQCLVELDRFEAAHAPQISTRLVDAETESLLADRVEAHDGVFAWNGDQTQHALSDVGTFRVLDSTGATIFEATKFTQDVIDAGADRVRAHIRNEHGATLEVAAIRDHRQSLDSPAVFPTRLLVQRTEADPDRFSYIVGALRSVFAASVETQMPVVWC